MRFHSRNISVTGFEFHINWQLNPDCYEIKIPPCFLYQIVGRLLPEMWRSPHLAKLMVECDQLSAREAVKIEKLKLNGNFHSIPFIIKMIQSFIQKCNEPFPNQSLFPFKRGGMKERNGNSHSIPILMASHSHNALLPICHCLLSPGGPMKFSLEVNCACHTDDWMSR